MLRLTLTTELNTDNVSVIKSMVERMKFPKPIDIDCLIEDGKSIVVQETNKPGALGYHSTTILKIKQTKD